MVIKSIIASSSAGLTLEADAEPQLAITFVRSIIHNAKNEKKQKDFIKSKVLYYCHKNLPSTMNTTVGCVVKIKVTTIIVEWVIIYILIKEQPMSGKNTLKENLYFFIIIIGNLRK